MMTSFPIIKSTEFVYCYFVEKSISEGDLIVLLSHQWLLDHFRGSSGVKTDVWLL